MQKQEIECVHQAAQKIVIVIVRTHHHPPQYLPHNNHQNIAAVAIQRVR